MSVKLLKNWFFFFKNLDVFGDKIYVSIRLRISDSKTNDASEKFTVYQAIIDFQES